MNPKDELAARDRRRHLLARMAGNVAPGFLARLAPNLDVFGTSELAVELRRKVARDSVDVARAILEETER